MSPFDLWFRDVDRWLLLRFGFGADDLPDQPWRDWYDDGLSPADAARCALEEEGVDL